MFGLPDKKPDTNQEPTIQVADANPVPVDTNQVADANPVDTNQADTNQADAATQVPLNQVDISNLDTSQSKVFRDFLSNYNRVSELCFRACIWDFTTRSVKDKESRCATSCVAKYLATNQRVSQRFQESQMLQHETLLQNMQSQ